jgi:hypothetical protein
LITAVRPIPSPQNATAPRISASASDSGRPGKPIEKKSRPSTRRPTTSKAKAARNALKSEIR